MYIETEPVVKISAFRNSSFTAALIAACLACAPTDTPSAADTTTELTLTKHGGRCLTPQGTGGECRLSLTIRDDGTWEGTGNMPPAPTRGTLKPGAASRLAAHLEENWKILTSRRFTGDCPTAYDGQEMIYTIRRLPEGPNAPRADADVREIGSCTWDLSHDEAREVLRRFDELSREEGLPQK